MTAVSQELLSPLDMTIETANSGEKALSLVKKNRYDVIFMDYMMPFMDGVETTEKIRSLAQEYEASGEEEEADYVRSVPIIALSGDNSDRTKEKFMRARSKKDFDMSVPKSFLLGAGFCLRMNPAALFRNCFIQ